MISEVPNPVSKVVLFSEMFYPDTTSTAYYLTEIARGLSVEFPVTVVTAKSDHAGESLAGIRIYRCATAGAGHGGLLARGLASVGFCMSALWRGIRVVRRGDVVFTVTNPPLLPYFALLLAYFKSARFVLLVHDVYPEVLATAGILRSDSLPYKCLAACSRYLLRRSRPVIALGRDMQAVFTRKGCSPAQIHLIPNWAENELIPVLPKRDNQWLAKLGLRDAFIILYAGNSGRTHDIEVILGAARHLRAEKSLHFLIAGFGRRLEDLQNSIRRDSLANISVEPFAFPRAEQVQTLSAGDVALITFVPGMAGVSVPSRMYNVMAAGRPIIAVADAESELARVVTEEAIGWVVPPGDARGLAAAVLAARDHPVETRQMGERAARAAREKYSLELALAGYRTAVRKVAAPVSKP